MASKKKSKGVLERIGEATSSAAEVVIDAGSKAIHAVGDMMPTGTPKKGPKASKAKAPKASAKTSKAAPKTSPKASKPPEKVEAKTKTAAPKAAVKKTTPTKSAKPAAKATPSGKAKRPVGRKG